MNNSSLSLDVLLLRVPPLNYVCPPICIVEFSGSAFPFIDLEDFNPLNPPGPLEWCPDCGGGGGAINFPNYPGFLCMTVAQLQDDGRYIVVDECICQNNSCVCVNNVICWPPPGPGCYKFQIITDQGATPFSDPICIVAPTIQTNPATGVACS